jgi:hypothetical protein
VLTGRVHDADAGARRAPAPDRTAELERRRIDAEGALAADGRGFETHASGPQGAQLRHEALPKRPVLQGQHPRQRGDAGPRGMRTRRVALFGQPTPHEPSPPLVERGERTEERAVAPVEAFAAKRFEAPIAVRTDERERMRARRPLEARHDEDVLAAEFEEPRALPDLARVVADGPVERRDERVEVRPRPQVLAAVQQDLTHAPDRAADEGVPRVVLAPHPRVPERVDRPTTQPMGRPHHRVVRVFRPVHEVRGTRGQAGDLVAVAGAAVEDRRCAPIVDEAAGPTAVEIGRRHPGRERDRRVVPAHEVVADGVAPGRRAPTRPQGVVLVEHVVPTPPMHHAVGVVHPTRGRHQVEAGAVRVGRPNHPLTPDAAIDSTNARCRSR